MITIDNSAKQPFRIGEHVQDFLILHISGTIDSRVFKVRGEKMQIVKLDKPFYSEDKSVYVSHLMFHVSGIRRVSKQSTNNKHTV